MEAYERLLRDGSEASRGKYRRVNYAVKRDIRELRMKSKEEGRWIISRRIRCFARK